ncbi:MAG: sigma 54-interacting transcriptional regulator [Planctomycetota bacterium]
MSGRDDIDRGGQSPRSFFCRRVPLWPSGLKTRPGFGRYRAYDDAANVLFLEARVMSALLRVLVIETDDATRDVILGTLPLKDCEVSFASTEAEGLELLSETPFTAVILANDKSLDHAREFVTRAKEVDPLAGVFVLQQPYEADAAVRLVAAGAFDVLSKPLDAKNLKRALFPFLLHKSQDSQAGELAREEQRLYQFHGVVGKNPQMLEIIDLIERAARHFFTALVTGETGTGKDLIARALHEARGGAPDSFIYASCAGSAQPGFISDLITKCSQSARRTVSLYLDEAAELAPSAQADLLKLLQQRSTPGATLPNGLSIIISSSKELGGSEDAPAMMPELYRRLTALHLELPPLRDRLDDVPLLCQTLLERLRDHEKRSALGVTRAALITLMRYRWPGNIRELEHVLERACIMTDEDFLTPDDLPQIIRESATATDGDNALLSVPDSLEEMERIHIAHVLKKSDYNKVAASKMLGISRSTLYQKMAKYRLTDPTRQPPQREDSPPSPVSVNG